MRVFCGARRAPPPTAHKAMKSAHKKTPEVTRNAPSGEEHSGRRRDVRVQNLPDYKKLAVPHTLQGFYAKGNGCPCVPKTTGTRTIILPSGERYVTRDGEKLEETYRPYGPGPHKVYPADEIQAESTCVRDLTTGQRLMFPNARNYGGTVTHRTFPMIGHPRRKTKAEKEYDRMYDRKEFLKAVLRDEMRHRLSAEEQLESFENELGLRGSRHARRLAEEARRSVKEGDEDERVKTVGDQHDEVMEELRYVTSQPVGSKLNIIRLHYLLEEQERLKYLRDKEKKQASGLMQTTSF